MMRFSLLTSFPMQDFFLLCYLFLSVLYVFKSEEQFNHSLPLTLHHLLITYRRNHSFKDNEVIKQVNVCDCVA